MKPQFFPVLGFILFLFFTHISADADNIYLRKIRIKGNKITKEQYVRQFITLEEGKTYDLDTILNEINLSRNNLEKTHLFSGIFFDDELDEENNLTLTVQLKEKSYLNFGPSGYIIYENEEFHLESAVYIEYENLFGKAASLLVEVSFYEYTGFSLYHQNLINRWRYSIEFEDNYSITEERARRFLIPGVAYKIGEYVYSGINFEINFVTPPTFIFFPFLEGGFNERYTHKIKRWHYYYISPFYGLNSESSSVYGLSTEINFYWDLLLKIVYALMIDFNLQDGEIPESRILYSTVRGTNFKDYSGDIQISLKNELLIPWPWNTSFSIVPFFDLNLIGEDILIGGGFGLHWFNKLQDPLVMELAYGKGIMLNFQKRF